MYEEQGIRCNAIAPGGVLTDIPLVMPPADEFGFGRTSALLAHSPEMGMPEDIANAACSSYMKTVLRVAAHSAALDAQ